MSSGHFEALRQEVKKYKKDEEEKTVQIKDLNFIKKSLKGGDPAAGSPTATLLRLHPSHRSHRRRSPPEG